MGNGSVTHDFGVVHTGSFYDGDVDAVTGCSRCGRWYLAWMIAWQPGARTATYAFAELAAGDAVDPDRADLGPVIHRRSSAQTWVASVERHLEGRVALCRVPDDTPIAWTTIEEVVELPEAERLRLEALVDATAARDCEPALTSS